jgi:hypothetical protein
MLRSTIAFELALPHVRVILGQDQSVHFRCLADIENQSPIENGWNEYKEDENRAFDWG